MSNSGTERETGAMTMPLSSEDAREAECTRCDHVGRVWPLEQPSDIVMELDWGYAWLCLECWRSMERFIGGGSA